MSTTSLKISEPTPSSTRLAPPNPFLKWAGSKRQHVELVSQLYEPYRTHRWVEPFLGSGALPIAIAPTQVLASDINPHLIDLWQWVQQDGICTHPIPSYESESYQEMRTLFNALATKRSPFDLKLKCELFLWLNRTCFNGLYRTNQDGQFNVPIGRHKNPKIPRDLSAYKEAIAHWTISHAPFEATLSQVTENDFVFLDPPYWDGKKTEFSAYFGKFDWDAQILLAELAANLPCPVVLCNAPTEQMATLYEGLGFEVRYHPVRRSISSKGDRNSVQEIVALKNFN